MQLLRLSQNPKHNKNLLIWPQLPFYPSIKQIITLGIVISYLSGRIKKHATEEFYIFSHSCDLVQTSCSPLIHIHAPQYGGISLIKRFLAMFFHLLLLISSMTSSFTVMSMNFRVACFTKYVPIHKFWCPFSHTAIQHNAQMHEASSQLLWQYYDRTLPQFHLIKTMTLQGGSKVVKHANNAMPSAI